MKSTNTRKNRGKKSRDFKNTQKGGKRNKVVFNRKKTLRGKKKYTRRNRWKKNFHRGRQFLDVMVGGAQRNGEPVKISKNMVIYTLLDYVDQPDTDTKSKKFFTMNEYNNLNMLIFFIIELNDVIPLNESNTLSTYFSKLEGKILNSLNTHNCQEFDRLSELNKYDIFVYAFTQEPGYLFKLVTHVSYPKKENTDISPSKPDDLLLKKVKDKLIEYESEEAKIYKLTESLPKKISNNKKFIKIIEDNYNNKYNPFIYLKNPHPSISGETIKKYFEKSGSIYKNYSNNQSINDILNKPVKDLTEDNIKKLLNFFNLNEKVIFP